MKQVSILGLVLLGASCCLAFLESFPTGGTVVGVIDTKCLAKTNVMSTDPLSVSIFPYEHKFNNNYTLAWDFNTTHIMFKATAKTVGYVALGIAKQAKMFPSDMALAGVKNGQKYIMDAHVNGHTHPTNDKSQDWTILSGTESAGTTTVIMIRKLDTCDTYEDLPITNGNLNIIWAFVREAPKNGIHYHFHNRGLAIMSLLTPSAADTKQ